MAESGNPTKWYPIPLSIFASTVIVVASTPKTALPMTFTHVACTFKIGL